MLLNIAAFIIILVSLVGAFGRVCDIVYYRRMKKNNKQ